MTGAYYNEKDPHVAAWLRELIRRNLIAYGEVDERSIEVVQPEDVRGFVQCHFFAGVGVWSYALRLAGWPDDRPVWTGSCPCQPFSAAGKGEGGDDPRHLWPTWFRLIRQCRPVTVFGEQVESAIRDGWLDLVSTDLEAEGYAVGSPVFGAHSVGAFHKRQRLYFVADTDGARAGERRGDVQRRGRSSGRQGNALGRDDALASGTTRHMVNAESGGRGVGGGDRSGARRVGDTAGGGLDARRVGGTPSEATREGERQLGADDAGGDGGMGDAEREGLQRLGGDVDRTGESRRVDPIEDGPARTSGEPRDMADAGGDRCEQAGGSESEAGSDGSFGNGGAGGESFWSDAEWIACTDGKARPVEPGTFPLVNGAPFRVVRLRGYGNALVAQAAETFITAYIEVRGF